MNTKSVVASLQKNGNELEMENQLLNSGFSKTDFLRENTVEDVYLLSIAVKNDEELNTAKSILQTYKPHHIYEFPFIAENANRIRSYVEAAAKTQIFDLPQNKKHGNGDDGINSEVIIGK